MNFAFAICCLAALVIFASATSEPKTAEEYHALAASTSKECAEEFKILPKTLLELKESTEKLKFDASDDLKCYFKCFGEKIGIYVDDKVNVDRLVEAYVVAHGKEESKIRTSSAICIDKATSEKIDCNASWTMYACFADNL